MHAKQIKVSIGTHEDAITAVSVIGKCRVIGCPNPADAASPVTLHAGNYARQIGQSADYRHDITESVAKTHEAGAIVQGWWDNDAQAWYTTVESVGRGIDENAVRDIIRERIDRRQAAEQAERKANADAERAAATKERQAVIADAVELARQAGESWAPGRIRVKISQRTGQIIVGRWNEPYCPGHGKPDEVRRAVKGDGGSLVLVECDDSFRFMWD